MKKHIKIRAELVDNKTRVKITILEQSHFLDHFAGRKTSFINETHAFCHGNLRMASHAGNLPKFRIGGLNSGVFKKNGVVDKLYVAHFPSQFPATFTVTLKDYPAIKKCIEAYNSYEFTK